MPGPVPGSPLLARPVAGEQQAQTASKVLAQPVTEATEEPVWRPSGATAVARHLGTLRQSKMQEPRRRRESRSPSCFSQPCNLLRPADPNLLVEDQRGEFACPMQLTGTARKHHSPA